MNDGYAGQAEESGRTGSDPAVLSREDDVMKKVEKRSVLKALTEDFRLLYDLLHDYYSGRYPNVSKFALGMIAFTLFYVLSPIDLVPDFIPVIGFADDVIVLTVCFAVLNREIKAYKKWRTTSNKPV